MIPWERLDSVTLAGGGELRLARRGDEFSIRLAPTARTVGTELMNSRLFGSEEALARLACEALMGRGAPVMLIGGLGMGFTLRAALAALPRNAQVLVAELIPAVVAWARGPLQPVFGDCLDDPRVSVRTCDVGAAMREARGRLDAILLDVDNGPDGLTVAANDALYGFEGLAAARAALVPGGVLAIWSSHPDARFAERLQRTGFAVVEHRVRAGRKGPRHVVWVARKAGGSKENPQSRSRRPRS